MVFFALAVDLKVPGQGERFQHRHVLPRFAQQVAARLFTAPSTKTIPARWTVTWSPG